MPKNQEPHRIRIEEVAALAGVSTATVSRVLNKKGIVAPETAERVFASVTELGYVPHAAARGLASRKTNALGILFPEISGVFFSALLRGIETYVAANGYSLLLYATQGRILDPHDPPPLNESNCDGLIIFTDSLSEAHIRHLHGRGFPLVILHRTPPEGVAIPCITFENKNGARQMVEHLLSVHGYRRIAYLAAAGVEDSHWREMGYREALAAHSIPFDPVLVGMGQFDAHLAEVVVQQWLAQGVALDAIFAGDDESARGAIRAIQQAGQRVPEDVAVVGFDDSLLSQYLTPPLTTVRAPIEEAGQGAAAHLIRLIRTGQTDMLTLLPTELVIRRSCGCEVRD
ncbi:MAG: LacI family DNA-binding transcriptional regulator [Candidatus Promineifilaceae bacterium]